MVFNRKRKECKRIKGKMHYNNKAQTQWKRLFYCSTQSRESKPAPLGSKKEHDNQTG